MIGYTITGLLPRFGGNGYLLIDAANPAVQYRFTSRRVDDNGQQVDFDVETADGYRIDLEQLEQLQRPVTPDNYDDNAATLRLLGEAHGSWLHAGRPATDEAWGHLNDQLDRVATAATKGIAELRRWLEAKNLWQIEVMHSRDLAATPVGPEHASQLDAVHWLAGMLGGRTVLDAVTGRALEDLADDQVRSMRAAALGGRS